MFKYYKSPAGVIASVNDLDFPSIKKLEFDNAMKLVEETLSEQTPSVPLVGLEQRVSDLEYIINGAVTE